MTATQKENILHHTVATWLARDTQSLELVGMRARFAFVGILLSTSLLIPTTGAYASQPDTADVDSAVTALESVASSNSARLLPASDESVLVDSSAPDEELMVVDATVRTSLSDGSVSTGGAVVSVSSAASPEPNTPAGTVDIVIRGAVEASTSTDDTSVATDLSTQGDYVVIRPQAAGVQILNVVTDRSATEAFSYDIRIPKGAEIWPLDGGGYIVEDADDQGMGIIEPAWAVDAAGRSVPTRYTLTGSVLTQTVDHLSGEFTYPIVADPAWSYAATAIAAAGDGRPLAGSETPAQVLAELRRCFNCSFPIAGAPRAYPANGQLINLNASPFSFFLLAAPVRYYKVGATSNPDFQFIAQPGHFDGAGSSINFRFYKPSGFPTRIAINAAVVVDRGPVNSGNQYVARTQWNTFMRNLVVNIPG